jgi:hypothetical protein
MPFWYNVQDLVSDALGVAVLSDIIYGYLVDKYLVIAQCLVAACEDDANMLICLYEKYVRRQSDTIFNFLKYAIHRCAFFHGSHLILRWHHLEDENPMELNRVLVFNRGPSKQKLTGRHDESNPNNRYLSLCSKATNSITVGSAPRGMWWKNAAILYHAVAITSASPTLRNNLMSNFKSHFIGLSDEQCKDDRLYAAILANHLFCNMYLHYCEEHDQHFTGLTCDVCHQINLLMGFNRRVFRREPRLLKPPPSSK